MIPWGWYPKKPKRPPPKRGIKVKKTGSTWWGQRWIDALVRMSLDYSSRLARGRTYARAGRVHDLVVRRGEVVAKVTGSRATPYKVRLVLKQLSDTAWTEAIAAMAGKAQFTADLLAGQMPQEIDTAFAAAGTSLFPAKRADLQTDCSCPDWANPCKHVAATHYVLGEAFDHDPFLLFELRGRTRDDVLEALHTARAGGGGRKRDVERRHEVPGVTLGRFKAADYDKLRAPLPDLNPTFAPPPMPGALLKQLGIPPAWTGDDSPAELFEPLLHAAAERARRLALAEPDASEVPPDPNRVSRSKRAVATKSRKR